MSPIKIKKTVINKIVIPILDVACKIQWKKKQKKYGIRRIFFCDKQGSIC